jgi:hypothetical protein
MQAMDHWLHQKTYLESLGVHILNLFANIVKIDGVHKGIDKGIHSIHKETKFVNLFDENEHVLESKIILMSFAMQTFTFGDGVTPPTSNSYTPTKRACKFLDV